MQWIEYSAHKDTAKPEKILRIKAREIQGVALRERAGNSQMLASQTSMTFEKLGVCPHVFSVNISKWLFDQMPLPTFLRTDVVTQIWGERICMGDGAEVYLF